MLVPDHLNPLTRGKGYTPPPPPISGSGYHWQLQKHPLFRAFSGNLIFPLPEKVEMRMRPPRAIEWGRGGRG